MFCPAVSMRSAPHGTGQAGDYNVGLDKSSGARRIDAAIKAVIDIDHDALRGSRTFQPRYIDKVRGKPSYSNVVSRFDLAYLIPTVVHFFRNPFHRLL